MRHPFTDSVADDTLKVNSMKEQFITNTLKGYFIDRNTVSVNDEGTCMYRGSNGCKCAVGQHIPNSKYRKSMEGRSADAIGMYMTQIRDGQQLRRPTLEDVLSKKALSMGLKRDTWAEMQMIHDRIAGLPSCNIISYAVDSINNALKQIESNEGITLPVLRELVETTIVKQESV